MIETSLTTIIFLRTSVEPELIYLLSPAEPPTSTDLSVFIRILCVMYETMLNYTEDGAEASASEYAAGGSSAEAYGDVSLARNDSQPHFGGGGGE